MRRYLAVLFFIALAALSAIPVQADPTSDLVAMQKAWSQVKSFHADIATAQGRTVSIDYILPDKIHEIVSNKMEMIFLGTEIYMKTGSSWMKSPVPMMAPMKVVFESSRRAGLEGEVKHDYTISDEGAATVNGTPATKYHLVNKTNGHAVDMYLASNHLPLQVAAPGDRGPTTITYSKYNSVPEITAPI